MFFETIKCEDFEIFNLGESKSIKLIDLIRSLELLLGKSADIEQLPEQPGDVPITYADISKASELLDYRPSMDIEQGLEEFIKWYRQSKSLY